MESKGAIFWLPLVLAIGVAEAYRVGRGWETPTSDKFYALRVSCCKKVSPLLRFSLALPLVSGSSTMSLYVY